MVDWTQLRDVYGSTSEVPALLEAAASSTDWDSPTWQELWSRLYHQGSVAPASYAALPGLARLAVARPDVAVDPALLLFASIIASADGPPDVADARTRYAAQIAALIPVAEHKLDLVRDRTGTIYALQALAAVEDLSVWQRHLEILADGEANLTCPACREPFELALPAADTASTTDLSGTRRARSLPSPAEPAALAAAEARLVDLCQVHGHSATADQLLDLFGEVSCPRCAVRFRIADGFA